MSIKNVFEYLDLRYKWEVLCEDLVLPEERKVGTLENLKWFIQEGARNNRFRGSYEEALKIAKEIV